MATIGDIINGCMEIYGQRTINDNLHTFQLFVRRELSRTEIPKKKEKPYKSLLVDKTVLFGYLGRLLKLETPQFSDGTLINTAEKLHLLRTRPIGSWPDIRLDALYSRRKTGSRYHKLPIYTRLVNLIGADKHIVDVWGREIDYDADIKLVNRPSNNGDDRLPPVQERARTSNSSRRGYSPWP